MRHTIWISALLVATTSAALAQPKGEDTYKEQCVICHGETGTSDTPAGKAFGAKSLVGAEVVKASNATLLATIKNGSGKMPPFKDKLTDAQINDVISYIRTLKKK